MWQAALDGSVESLVGFWRGENCFLVYIFVFNLINMVMCRNWKL